MPKRSRLSRNGNSVRKDRMRKIGVISIDSGQVVVTDPAYIGKTKYSLPSYEEIGDTSLAGKSQLKNKIGVNLAVVSPTGLGDGIYPVYAVEGETDSLGVRVKKLIIDFQIDKMKGMK